MFGIQPVIEKVGGDPLNCFAGAAAKGIGGERDRKARGGDIRELVPDVPAVGRGATWIHHGVQVAVEVIVQRIGPKDLLLVVRIVGRGGQRRGQGRSRKGPANRRPSACRIVGVRQIAICTEHDC